MVKYSWKKINDRFGWNAYNVLQYFYMKQGIPIPTYLRHGNKKIVHKYVTHPYPKGDCFLINPNDLLDSASNPNDIYLYLELASKRNVFDYQMRKVKHLPLVMAEEYQLQWIELNPLLTIQNENIYFKFEQEQTE